MSQKHPDFSTLAARITVSNLHKNTSDSFFETCRVLYEYKNKQGRPAALSSDEAALSSNEVATIEVSKVGKSHLLRVHGKIVERPQHMLLRVACGIHSGDVKAAI